MRLSLPHDLGAEEVRRRLNEHSHEIAEQFPAGMATVETDWPNDDRMDLLVKAMGQRVEGAIHVEDDMVLIELDIPPMLSFLRPMVEGGVREYGTKMLTKD